MEKALGTRLSYVNAHEISKMYFSSVYYDFYRHGWIRMTVRFWNSVPDGPDAIYIFTITAEILERSLANFYCQ